MINRFGVRGEDGGVGDQAGRFSSSWRGRKNENSSWKEDLTVKSFSTEYKFWALDMAFYALTIAIFAATAITGELRHFFISIFFAF